MIDRTRFGESRNGRSRVSRKRISPSTFVFPRLELGEKSRLTIYSAEICHIVFRDGRRSSSFEGFDFIKGQTGPIEQRARPVGERHQKCTNGPLFLLSSRHPFTAGLDRVKNAHEYPSFMLTDTEIK